MTFPHINTKTKNFQMTAEIEEKLNKQLISLEHFLPRKAADMVCDVELEKVTEHHQTGKIYRAEITLKINGTVLRAEATEETMENAIDRMKNEIKEELRRTNSRSESLMRRGARRAKEMFRFGG